jgi:hypothetical protein
MIQASLLSTKSRQYWNDNSTLKNLSANNEYSDPSDTNNPKAALSFINSLNDKNVDSGLLPPGVRVFLPGFVIFERPPSMQMVQYIDANVDSIREYEDSGSFYEDGDSESGEYHEELNSYSLRIPVPWQLYMATYSTNPASMYRVTSIRMYFMNTPLNHPDVELYAPYVNNFFTDGSLCTPMFDTIDEIDRYPQNLAGVIASAYDWIWNTGFNADLKECIDINFNHNIARKNPVIKDFLTKYGIREYKPELSRYAAFYDYMSQLSVTDIINLEWASPSYGHHFDMDKEFLFLNDEALLAEFHDSEYYNPDSDDEYYDFKRFLPDVSQISKTYSNIIDSMFFSKRTRSMVRGIYSDLTAKNNIVLSSPSYFCQSLANHIQSNPSILVDSL